MATVRVYTQSLKNALDGTAAWDWNTDTIKCALVKSTYTPASDSHAYWSDVTPGTNEASGTGYTSGGATMTVSGSPSISGAVISFDAADVSWASSSITARYAVVYKSTGTAATSPLIALVDFASDQTTSNGTFTVSWNASGVFQITCS
jgi:hypothetical protein